MTIQMLTITPEKAIEILSNNPRNRPITTSHVEFLARQMREGNWKKNGSTIVLSGNLLLDGQHRLTACIESKAPFDSLVVSDVDPETQDTMDTGKNRSAADVLGMRGEKNATLLVATLRVIEDHKKRRWFSKYRYSNVEIEKLLEKYPNSRESVELILSYRGSFPQYSYTAPPSMLSALHFLFSEKGSHEADEFMRKLITGLELKETDPLYLLRNKLMQSSMDPRYEIKNTHKKAFIVITWNRIRARSRIKRYQWDGKTIPKIL